MSYPSKLEKREYHRMTEAQEMALKLGQKIRNIVCMDSLASRFFDTDQRNEVRKICDEAMNRLGYESITDHRERINEHFIKGPLEWPRSLYKYQKLENCQ